jgi:hypothetical protein
LHKHRYRYGNRLVPLTEADALAGGSGSGTAPGRGAARELVVLGWTPEVRFIYIYIYIYISFFS